MTRLYRSSPPDKWTLPRQSLHASERLYRHGPVRPMPEDRGFWARLFGRVS